MKYNGKIKELNHIVFSDPGYKKDVWCRYEKENINEKDLFVDMNIQVCETEMKDYKFKTTEFMLLIKKDNNDCEVDNDGNLSYLNNIEVKEYTIGADSACVALGINDKAKEIINSYEEWQPLCAIRTGTDGTIGNVYEGTKNGNFSFIALVGAIDNDMLNESELFDYLKNQFEIEKLVKQIDIYVDKNNKLNIGDIVEVSKCDIANDVGGTTTIRNKNYKDELEGLELAVKNSFGTIEHTTLDSHDKLINIPIEIEVMDILYDYETGFHYKGKVKNEKLIEEFKKCGTTGFKPDDYKQYKNRELYENALKASKSFDPSIVCFSEFDVVNHLEKNKNNEVEL